MRTKQPPGLAGVLFGKSMRAILALLYGRPEQRFYVREIARAAGTQASSLQRDLAALAAAGIIERYELGRQVYYQASVNCPIFRELKGIVAKTFGIADLLRTMLQTHEGKIRAAFVYGSVAKGTDVAGSDVDLMVIGDVRPSALAIELNEVGMELGRRVSMATYSVHEFTQLTAAANHFVSRVLEGPLIWLIGDKEGLDSRLPLKSQRGLRRA